MPAIIRCPICKKDVPVDDPEMPFCSKRCRLIDLGNWADERYVISSPASPSDFAEEATDLDFHSSPPSGMIQ